MEKLAKDIGIILPQNVVAAVVDEIHARVGECAAHAAVLLRIIAGRNRGRHELTQRLGEIERGPAVVFAGDDGALHCIQSPRPR